MVCRRICRTVCTTDHLSVHALVPELNEWVYDSQLDNNPREFVTNNTLYQERHPAQYLRGVGADTLGQEVAPLNITCTPSPDGQPNVIALDCRQLLGGKPLLLCSQIYGPDGPVRSGLL